MQTSLSWIALQLSDSAFPSGGFVHSGGLEAAWRFGELHTPDDVSAFIDSALWQAGSAQWPFAGETHRAPENLKVTDRAIDAFLIGHVTNRASRQQGRALAGASARIFSHPVIFELDKQIRSREALGHFAPAFGLITGVLGLSREEACRIALHAALRGVMSAAIRLGLLGPQEAQRMTHARTPLLDSVLTTCLPRGPHQASQSAPLLEIFATAHDRLDERLFVS